jgi:hypothetical protein
MGDYKATRNCMSRRFVWMGCCIAALFLGGCAQYGFDIRGEGGTPALHVGTSQDTALADDPLRYRFRSVDGRLVMWINNPTADPIELLGDKSRVTDPDDIDHPLHSQIIAPGSSIKEVLPPLESFSQEPAPSPPQPGNPYGQSGFIATPDVGNVTPAGPGPGGSDYLWQWDDDSDIRLDLVFLQNQAQIEQRFIIHRARE